MTNSLTARPEAVNIPTDLEGMLTWLQTFGKPIVGMYGDDNTWHCSIEMHVTSIGASFKIKSRFDCTSPSTATRECCERVVQTLRDLGVAR